MTVPVAILGATGYTALELIRIVLRHPDLEIVALTSRQEGSPHVASVHPSLAGRLDLKLEDLSPDQIAARAECVFSCLPHGASAIVVKPLVDAGARVIDFSADYRLRSLDVYEQWYDQKHPDPQRLGQVVYGMPELFGAAIPAAPLVANPGCYPTGALLPLAPLVREGLIEPADIIIDSKSGVTGAGRTPKLMTHYPECNESVAAYNIGRHRHTPEIDDVLQRATGRQVEVVFTPHLIPMDRGILTTSYARSARSPDEQQLIECLRESYRGAPFVRVVEHLPATKDTAGTNFCDVTVRVVRGRVILISSIDNLGKGASSGAVQNFNLMYGYPETTAL